MPDDIPSHPNSSPFQKVAECLYRNSSSGVYYALVKRGGKQHRRSLRTKDRKVADRFLSDFRQKVGRLSKTSSASHVTFRDLAERWLETMRAHLKPSSFRRRETSVGQLCAVMGAMTIRQVTTRTCEEWAAKRGPGLQASTYNNERDTLRVVLAYAKREGLLLDNPAELIPRRKLPRRSPVIPTREQFVALVNQLREMGKRCREAAVLVELLAYSGMRLAEATSMRWGDVNFENNRFTVTGGDTGTKNHEAREVPLFPSLRAFLDRIKVETSPNPEDLIVGIRKARRAMEKACEEAKLPVFTHHTLRHFFVSNAIELNVDAKTIAAWVGHKDGGLLVAKTYGHLRDTHSREMAQRMQFSATRE